MRTFMHKINVKKAEIPHGGLTALNKVTLSDRNQKILEKALSSCGGATAWKKRKQAEARDLLALAQVSGRMSVKEIDISATLRAVVYLEVPVPQLIDGQGELKIAEGAIIGLMYREEAVVLPQSGFSYIQILSPNHIWHANVSNSQHSNRFCREFFSL